MNDVTRKEKRWKKKRQKWDRREGEYMNIMKLTCKQVKPKESFNGYKRQHFSNSRKEPSTRKSNEKSH